MGELTASLESAFLVEIGNRMTKVRKKILFIGHEASRTGAPIVLLHFLRWLKGNTNVLFEILIARGEGIYGELVPEFQALAPVTVLSQLAPYDSRLIPRAMRKVGITHGTRQHYLHDLKHRCLNGDLGLIYSNTVVNANILKWLSGLSVPVITHVHELEYIIRHAVGINAFEHVLYCTDRFVAVSEAVRRNLIDNHGVPLEKVSVVHEFVPTAIGKNGGDIRCKLISELGLQRDTLFVGGSGTLHWRKGPDLFVQLVRYLRDSHLSVPVCLFWIGGPTEGPYFNQLCHDMMRLGLESAVRFLGNVTNPLDYIDAMDVFVLTSREDPFPLVCLEAASMRKPIVCFAGAGGAPEFVEDDCGFVVPYLDVQTMAQKVSLLLSSVDGRSRFGMRAAEKVAQRHDVEVAAPKILEIMEQFI